MYFNDLDGTLPPDRLPAPTDTTLGGVKAKAGVAHNFLTSVETDGSLTAAQPAFSDLSGSVPAITALTGDVTASGTGSVAATVAFVGGVAAATIAANAGLAGAAVSTNTPNTIVKRDGSGNFTAGTITAALTGNVTGNVTGNLTGNASGSAASFTGSLVGDVTGTQGATVVSTVATSTAANVHAAELLANAATNLNTASTIVKRDGSGNFTAGTITAALTGNVTGNVSGTAATITGNVTASQLPDPTSSTKGGVKSLASASHQFLTQIGTDGSVSQAQPAYTDLSGSVPALTALTGDVTASGTGSQAATVANVGGTAAATIAAGAALANGAVSAATASKILLRDSNANANLNNLIEGFATTATAGATTTLTVASAFAQTFTGSTTQTVVLPDATTLVAGHSFLITNRSSGTVTVNKNGGSLALAVTAGYQVLFTVTAIGTSAGTWDAALPPAPTGTLSGLTSTRIPYATSATALADDSALNWDATNHRLGIGTASPAEYIQVSNAINGNTVIETKNANGSVGGNTTAHTIFRCNDGTNETSLVCWPIAHSSGATLLADTGGTYSSKPNGLAFQNTAGDWKFIKLSAGVNTLLGRAIYSTGNFEWDGSTFNIDAVNNRVGIAKASPATPLDVVGIITGSTNIVSTGGDFKCGTDGHGLMDSVANLQVSVSSTTGTTITGKTTDANNKAGSRIGTSVALAHSNQWITQFFNGTPGGVVAQGGIDPTGHLSTALPNPLVRKFGTYSLQLPTDATFTALNLPAATMTGTVTNTTTADTSMAMLQCATAASTNAAAGLIGPYTPTRFNFKPRYSFYFRTPATLTNVRILIGLADADVSGNATNAAFNGNRVAMFRYDSALDSSSVTWKFISSDGTTASVVDYGQGIAVNSNYAVQVDVSNSNGISMAIWDIGTPANNVVTNSSKTANLPTGTTAIGLHATITTLANVAVNLFIARAGLEQN